MHIHGTWLGEHQALDLENAVLLAEDRGRCQIWTDGTVSTAPAEIDRRF
jgi:hypothetical protein